MKPFQRSLIYCLPAAIAATGILYWIDDDPPYPDRMDTLAEATIIVAILYVLFVGISYAFNLMRQKKKGRQVMQSRKPFE